MLPAATSTVDALLTPLRCFTRAEYAWQLQLTGGVQFFIYRPRSASGEVRLCTKLYGIGEMYTTLFLGSPRCCGDSHHNDVISPQFSATIRR
jgi:hypothetical protein